jgi:hypothetical protein
MQSAEEWKILLRNLSDKVPGMVYTVTDPDMNIGARHKYSVGNDVLKAWDAGF